MEKRGRAHPWSDEQPSQARSVSPAICRGALAVAERMTARDGEGTAGSCLSASVACLATAEDAASPVMTDYQPLSAWVAGVGWAMPAALITAWAPAGQLVPLTRMFPVSTLLCGVPVATWVAPPLYQLPE